MLVGIFLTRQLHDAIPSTIRAGVASGVGTLTWMAFLPFALTFGVVSERMGVEDAGWMIVGPLRLTSRDRIHREIARIW